jgi:hypothetical protein
MTRKGNAGGAVMKRSPQKKLAALRLERFKMHAAIFALGTVLGAYQAAKDKAPDARHSSAPPSSATKSTP